MILEVLSNLNDSMKTQLAKQGYKENPISKTRVQTTPFMLAKLPSGSVQPTGDE